MRNCKTSDCELTGDVRIFEIFNQHHANQWANPCAEFWSAADSATETIAYSQETHTHQSPYHDFLA